MSSDFADTLGERLSRAAADLSYVQKDGTNEHFRYQYVSEARIKEVVSAAYRKHGLYIDSVAYQIATMSTPTNVVASCTVTVSGVGIADSGSFARFEGLGQGSDKGDKAAMKACAAALKYALTSGNLIATGDDPESDTSTDKPTPSPSKLTNGRIDASESKEFRVCRLSIDSAPDSNALDMMKANLSAKLTSKAITDAEFTALKAMFVAKKSTFVQETK